ncbi:MAG: M20/M25/M40 family metallo-hydrolase [Candidatus Eremiobacteraeota bacterium]|nr:M20/M25/M40 family metallo-hydrolase [Candidatus Eremiobacteraeota bacterium]
MKTPADLQATTEALVRIPSISSDRQACNDALDFLRSQLVDPDSFHLEVFEYQGYRSLIVSTVPGRQAPLILNGHVDVVWANDDQFVPQPHNGHLWGRGTYDMKGSVAVFLEILKDLGKLAPDQRPKVQFQFVSDEEIGGHRGVERMVDEGFDTELMIAGEPTDLGICHQAKGVYWLTLRLSGQAGHAARPWLTRNPVLALSRGLNALLARYPTPIEPIWQTTATPTGLSAGNSHNRVPDLVELKLDIRYVPEDSPDEIRRFLESVFPSCEIEVVQLAVPLMTAPDHPLVERVAALQEMLLGQRPRFFSEHFASDARYYSAKGTPAICWGPCGAGMHADDERVELESLHTYYRLVHQLLTLYR